MLAASYKVDFKAYMSLCESNYYKCMKLMPREDANHETVKFHLALPNGLQADVILTVKQRCKYTTMISIEKKQSLPWLQDLLFDVRLYHDANVLEIMRFQQQKTRHIRYRYPNTQMFHQDEKVQHLSFLAECLDYCLAFGLSQKGLTLLEK